MPVYAAPTMVARHSQFSVHVREDVVIGMPLVTVVCDACAVCFDDMNGNESWRLTSLGHWMVDHLYSCPRNKAAT